MPYVDAFVGGENILAHFFESSGVPSPVFRSCQVNVGICRKVSPARNGGDSSQTAAMPTRIADGSPAPKTGMADHLCGFWQRWEITTASSLEFCFGSPPEWARPRGSKLGRDQQKPYKATPDQSQEHPYSVRGPTLPTPKGGPAAHTNFSGGVKISKNRPYAGPPPLGTVAANRGYIEIRVARGRSRRNTVQGCSGIRDGVGVDVVVCGTIEVDSD